MLSKVSIIHDSFSNQFLSSLKKGYFFNCYIYKKQLQIPKVYSTFLARKQKSFKFPKV